MGNSQICVTGLTSGAPCSPPSRTLRAASGGGLQPPLTAAARDAFEVSGRDEETAPFTEPRNFVAEVDLLQDLSGILVFFISPGQPCFQVQRLQPQDDAEGHGELHRRCGNFCGLRHGKARLAGRDSFGLAGAASVGGASTPRLPACRAVVGRRRVTDD